jgi:hypothetical protein
MLNLNKEFCICSLKNIDSSVDDQVFDCEEKVCWISFVGSLLFGFVTLLALVSWQKKLYVVVKMIFRVFESFFFFLWQEQQMVNWLTFLFILFAIFCWISL